MQKRWKIFVSNMRPISTKCVLSMLLLELNGNNINHHTHTMPAMFPLSPRSIILPQILPTYPTRSHRSKQTHISHPVDDRHSVRRHPFVDGIMEVPLPPAWKPLNIERYDNTSHPDEHIDAYITQINLYTNEDAIMCRVFPTSLKGAALSWYTQLPPRSVDNFNTLVHLFSAQYATSKPHHITSATLSNLRQQDDESLRHFMERFANVSIKIRNLNPEVALHSMLMALKPEPFVYSLCRHQPASMDELRARAAGYIQMEEHAEFHNSVHDSFTTKGESSTREKSKTHFDQRSKRPRQSRGPRYEFYTPLNAPRVNILEEANHADLISLPPPAHNPVNADKSKHCCYHRNYI
ncbi:uncharacterized protein LOC109791794 [Cajanus cajan]|uniref:uncharacterized protein LOC109791794 n=1 Tax=Cajanus cajan TaxID=3821 RepID=UPI00098DBFA5|nr:uncharacterized protein LOC109791794 [Cajanus cajan]